MARRPKNGNVDALLAAVDRHLRQFGSVRRDLSLREKVLKLVEIYQSVKDLGVSALAEGGLQATQARDRIRMYLVEYVGEVIEGAELAVVAGISEYPRRIRELRREEGYQIISGASPDPNSGVNLRPDQYVLVAPEPDLDAARRWHVANRIRRSCAARRERLLAFLKENVGKVVTTEELAYVAGARGDYPRRVRELRTEEGYSIATMFSGRPDLKTGQYVLQSTKRIAEPHDRKIGAEVERAVYSRDNNSCRICGWNRGLWTEEDPRLLELHHIKHHRKGGSNKAENLMVICNKCHDEVHAGQHSEVLRRLE